MAQSPWYQSPAYLVVSIVSLITGLCVYLIHRKTLRHNIQRGLILQATVINEAFARHKVKSPYAVLLGIPEGRVESFNGKSILLLNQINLLRDVFDNRRQLGRKTVESYKKWATTIVRPWIEADDELRQVWELTRETKDLMGHEFVTWLEALFPLVTPRAHQGQPALHQDQRASAERPAVTS